VTKVSLRGLVRDEKGQALILALILLVIGGLIMAPLLAYMSTGVIAGGAYEKKADELYAADAGAEDAVLKIQQQTGGVQYLYCGGGNHSLSYNIADVNGKRVAVTITYVSNITHTYHVISTATGDGSGTKIDAYIVGTNAYGDYSGILGQVITSWDELELPNNPNVVIDPPVGEPHGPVGDYGSIGDWPDTPKEVAELADFYYQQVKEAIPYEGDTTIDLKDGNMELGPAYINGGLTVLNNNNKDIRTLKLTGTVYVKGDTQIGMDGKGTNKPNLILNLNGQTIFVESGSASALQVGDWAKIDGFGCIIAVGDILFKPSVETGTPDPVFLMSVSGTTHFQPSANFYGTVAGKVLVDIDPSAHVSITYPDDEGWYGDLNFLNGVKKLIFSIASWEVKPA
jgi:hypothetical protein